jgi:hypothetical protein
MNAILKVIRDVFYEPQPENPVPPAQAPVLMGEIMKPLKPVIGLYPLGSRNYRQISAHPEGLFSFWMSEEAIFAMKNEANISLSDIEPLASRTIEKCRELGFWHGESVHFVMNIQNAQRTPEWTTCKVTPPIPLPSGKMAEKSITVFLPTFLAEIRDVKDTILQGVQKTGRFQSEEMKRAYMARLDPFFRAKHQTILVHEMVHIFATDEYRDIMAVLGLEKLELLTDAISVVMLYRDFKGSDEWMKSGLIEGAGYITNLLRREDPSLIQPRQLMELLHQRARLIIKECQGLYLKSSRSEAQPQK